MTAASPLQLFEVGGAVRDALLGLPSSDRDWVAVGATPEQLLALGYRPVGRDFPVFLHPQTGDEVALARTERKSAPGYRGFNFHAAPEVTLEQDLARRDLTINAMARAADGHLIDPFGGERDLRAGVLRHVSPAFVEDPVRLLRVARFAARFHSFSIAPETMALLRRMVVDGEVDALVAERVWQELARGLMEARPSRMLEVLRDSGALARLLPGVWLGVLPSVQPDEELRRVLDTCGSKQAPLAVRFACLVHDADDGPAIAERWRVPSECKELALLLARERGAIQQSRELDAHGAMQLLQRCDALRRPQRFADLLQAVQCLEGDAAHSIDSIDGAKLLAALAAAQAVDSEAASRQAMAEGAGGAAIGVAVQAARERAIAASGLFAPARDHGADDTGQGEQ